MNVSDSLARFGLVPADEALPEIRLLLEGEAEAERDGQPREEDLALLCCVQLFSRGLAEDILRIWAAKRSGFDLGCYLDVQFLCGAGLARTKASLQSRPEPQAAEALAYIKSCENSGDFDEFTPEGHLAHYRTYFGSNSLLGTI